MAELRVLEPTEVHLWRSTDRRAVLAPYLGVQPQEIEFATTGAGKPTLAWPNTDIHFNVSHSGELQVVAVALGREVGVDVERIDPERATDAIAKRFFSPNELVELHRAPPGRQVEKFFDIWTAKEARLKATGNGLAGIESGDRPDLPSAHIDLPDGFAGCVAVESGPIDLVQF